MHLWPKLGEIPLIGFWYMVFTRFSWCTDSHTHSLTHRWTYWNAVRLWHHFSMVLEA